jgi:hypothetical protein
MAACEFEDGSHHKIWLNIGTPSTLQSQSSDCHVFGALKDAIHGVKFETIGNVTVVRTWLHDWYKAWYQQGAHTLALYQCKWMETL